VIKRSKAIILAGFGVMVLLTAIDLWSKRWAEDTLSEKRSGEPAPLCSMDKSGYILTQRIRTRSIKLVDNYLEFRYAENCGAAFGILHNAPVIFRSVLFSTAASLAIVALFWMFISGSGGPLFAYSVPLVTSGAIGNLIDRVNNGYVVDFIRFYIHDIFEWPTFNFADITITIGVVLLLLDGLRRPSAKAERKLNSA
jgi:signal peptidase II